MNFRTKLKLSIISLLLINGFIACEKKSSPSDNLAIHSETDDNILSWIAAGRNGENSQAFRKENLVKAYEVAKLYKEDSTKLKFFSKIQWSFLGLQDSLWFRKTNKEANLLAKKTQDSIRLAGSFWDLGVFFDQNEVKDSAYFNLSNAKKIYEALGNNRNAGKLEYDMAKIQADVKNYTSAEVGTVRAIELLKPLEDNLMLYRCYNLLGIVAKDLEEYDRSLEYYKTAEVYLKDSGRRDLFTTELANNIGTNYHEKGEFEKAVTYYKGVLDQDSLLTKNPRSYARTLNNLAQSQYRLNSEVDVEEILLRSLKIRDSVGDMAGLAGGYFILAEFYEDKKDTLKAIHIAKKSQAYAVESSNNDRLLESLELLTRLDPNNASIYGQKYITLNDSLQQEERKLRDKFARIQFETDEVVAENQLLARQKQLWTGIAASLLLLGGAIFIIVSQRAKNQKLRFDQEQQASNEKIFNLMLSEKQKFEEGKKIEQKRISEELHDGILGKMLGARMVLTGLNKKADQDAITERADAISALKQVEGEVRSISHELSHAAYKEIHNFIRSIRDLSQNICDAAGINHTFNYDERI